MAIGAIGGFASLFAESPVRPVQAGGPGQLTPEQQQEVQRLKATDQKVRQHEAAHQAAGAGLTSGANYEYVRGPDGKQYAVGGEVRIDVSPGATPDQTLEKARRIQAAALAPADPSPQDRAVAAQAAQMAAEARMESLRTALEENAGLAALTRPGQGQAGTGVPQGEAARAAAAAYGDQEPERAPGFSQYA
jgi:hypothetical protein